MNGPIFQFFFIFFATLGGARAFTLGGFFDISSEDSEESSIVGQHLPVLKNVSSSSQDGGKRPEKPSRVGRSRQHHPQLHRADYTEHIFERVLSGRVINELLDDIADCIDHSGIFDFLKSSEEEIDSTDSVTQGSYLPGATVATATAVTQPTTKKEPQLPATTAISVNKKTKN